MKKYVILFIFILFLNCNNKMQIFSSRDYAPNEETAIQIAIAVWEPLYGKRIYEQTPFIAKLENGIWYVEGTFNGEKNKRGGVAYNEIDKKNGKIYKVTHGR